MNFQCTIYLLRNSVNSKVYVGQTWKTPEERGEFGYGYRKSPLLFNAIQKHGWKNFWYEVLELCYDQEEADSAEEHYIKQFRSRDRRFGYNIKEGGSLGKMSEETKKKISLAQKGKKLSTEHKKKLSESHKGQVVWNKGIKTGQVPWNKGRKLPQFSGINHPHHGKSFSKEIREKMSKSAKTRPPCSKETKLKHKRTALTNPKIKATWFKRGQVPWNKKINNLILPEKIMMDDDNDDITFSR